MCVLNRQYTTKFFFAFESKSVLCERMFTPSHITLSSDILFNLCPDLPYGWEEAYTEEGEKYYIK